MSHDVDPFYLRIPAPGASDDTVEYDGLNEAFRKSLSARIGAVSTTRVGGVSDVPFDEFNVGKHVGDDPEAVRQNRRILGEMVNEEVEFCWLHQVHGTEVVRASRVLASQTPVEADACISRTPGLACVVMTADCLPVLICDSRATVVAAVHAGWRGLASGVLEATMEAMKRPADELMAWLGPAIGPDVFEVGDDVLKAFEARVENALRYFSPSPMNPDTRWVADLYGLARQRLTNAGVTTIFGGGACTYSDEKRFYSYRRDGKTGRMATAIWLRSPA